MSVFINRTINMRKIKAIGFDMDYTIVRYDTEAFEQLSHNIVLQKLRDLKDYPEEITDLDFDYQRSIQGLVIDKKLGNLLQVSRFGKVKIAYHGLKVVDFSKMQRIYRGRLIDLREDRFQSLDTSFSISNGVLFAQLVQLKDQGTKLPNFYELADDIRETIDIAHADGSLKGEVSKNISNYIIQEPELAPLFEKYKKDGKKLLVITNSDYDYCKLLMDYTVTPFLKEHKCWTELFDITITLSRKPHFFTDSSPLISIDPINGQMKNHFGPITNGIYQGGWAGQLQESLKLQGDEILYLGDHIYGDVVSIKKTFNWRTALVLDPLSDEINAIAQSRPVQEKINQLMDEKESIEKDIAKLYKKKRPKKEFESCYKKIDELNKEIGLLIDSYKSVFNPYWGEMMRAGVEESRFADQVEKYACLYMPRVSDLLKQSPKMYYRPQKRILPHEI